MKENKLSQFKAKKIIEFIHYVPKRKFKWVITM